MPDYLPFVNASGEAIPAFGVLRIASVSGGFPQIAKPNADGIWHLVNGPNPVAIGAKGRATAGPSLTAAYDTSSGTPAVGIPWGPAAGSWLLKLGKTGFVPVGAGSSGAVPVVVSQTAWTLAHLANVVIWSKVIPGKLFTSSGGSVGAGSPADPIGRIEPMMTGLSNLVQSSSGNRPTVGLNAAGQLEARGDGTGAYMDLATPVTVVGDFVAYALGTRINNANDWNPYGSNPGSGATEYAGLIASTAYFIPDHAASQVVSAAWTRVGLFLARWRRVGTTVYFATTGQAEATLSGVPAGHDWLINAVMARQGSEYTESGAGFHEWAVVNRALSAAEMALAETYLAGAAL